MQRSFEKLDKTKQQLDNQSQTQVKDFSRLTETDVKELKQTSDSAREKFNKDKKALQDLQGVQPKAEEYKVSLSQLGKADNELGNSEEKVEFQRGRLTDSIKQTEKLLENKHNEISSLDSQLLTVTEAKTSQESELASLQVSVENIGSLTRKSQEGDQYELLQKKVEIIKSKEKSAEGKIESELYQLKNIKGKIESDQKVIEEGSKSLDKDKTQFQRDITDHLSKRKEYVEYFQQEQRDYIQLVNPRNKTGLGIADQYEEGKTIEEDTYYRQYKDGKLLEEVDRYKASFNERIGEFTALSGIQEKLKGYKSDENQVAELIEYQDEQEKYLKSFLDATAAITKKKLQDNTTKQSLKQKLQQFYQENPKNMMGSINDNKNKGFLAVEKIQKDIDDKNGNNLTLRRTEARQIKEEMASYVTRQRKNLEKLQKTTLQYLQEDAIPQVNRTIEFGNERLRAHKAVIHLEQFRITKIQDQLPTSQVQYQEHLKILNEQTNNKLKVIMDNQNSQISSLAEPIATLNQKFQALTTEKDKKQGEADKINHELEEAKQVLEGKGTSKGAAPDHTATNLPQLQVQLQGAIEKRDNAKTTVESQEQIAEKARESFLEASKDFDIDELSDFFGKLAEAEETAKKSQTEHYKALWQKLVVHKYIKSEKESAGESIEKIQEKIGNLQNLQKFLLIQHDNLEDKEKALKGSN